MIGGQYLSHEVSLFVSMILFTTASFANANQLSFPLKGDIYSLLLITLSLLRYPLLRYLFTQTSHPSRLISSISTFLSGDTLGVSRGMNMSISGYLHPFSLSTKRFTSSTSVPHGGGWYYGRHAECIGKWGGRKTIVREGEGRRKGKDKNESQAFMESLATSPSHPNLTNAVKSNMTLLEQLPYLITNCVAMYVILPLLLGSDTSPWTNFTSYLALPFIMPLFSYGTVMCPFPDLVLNMPPLKTVQSEVSGALKSKNLRSKFCYMEYWHSAIYENRLKLISKVTLFRTIENVLLVVLLPHTNAACEFSRRCDPSSVYSTNMTNDKSYHGLVVFGLSVSVFIVTSSILLCQAITLNRSHLAAVAIVSGEWVNVDEEYTNKPNPPPPSWDPAKKYSKGDRVMVHFPRDNIYKAGTNNPIARPTDVFLRASYDLFSKEIGQPSSSYGISTVCKLHLIHTIFVAMICIMVFVMFDRIVDVATFAMLANVAACASMSEVGLTDNRKHNEWAGRMIHKLTGMQPLKGNKGRAKEGEKWAEKRKGWN